MKSKSQQKLYFSNIVAIKYKFPSNLVSSQVPQMDWYLRRSFKRSKMLVNQKLLN